MDRYLPCMNIPAPRRASKRRTCIAIAGVLLIAGLWCTNVSAERGDRDKPTTVDADKLAVDDLKQTNVFTGNVVLSKGTLVIRADQITVREDPEGFQYGVATANPGKLVFYRQKREGLNQFIEGVAERMEYDGKNERVRLINRAVMKRIDGTREADEVRGQVIDYDARTESYTVQGSAATASTPGGRVRAVIQPKVKTVPAPADSRPAATSPRARQE